MGQHPRKHRAGLRQGAVGHSPAGDMHFGGRAGAHCADFRPGGHRHSAHVQVKGHEDFVWLHSLRPAQL